MTTYVLKRALLMIPTIIGVSMVLWLLLTNTPGSGGGGTQDEAQSTKGKVTGGGESQRIFRAQYNLDKPLFFNDYVDLTPEMILEKIRTAIDKTLLFKDRNKASDKLRDWGYFAVPHLVTCLGMTEDVNERGALLNRLAKNAKRITPASMGKTVSPEDRQQNREIQSENDEIRTRFALQSLEPAELDEKTEMWRKWHQDRKERWEWSAGERRKIQWLNTKFARYWANLIRLDFGYSHLFRRPVLDLIFERMRISFALAVTSLILAYLISIPLGIWSATAHGSIPERGVSIVLFMLYSLPSFFAATLVLKYFGVEFKMIPVLGFESDDTFPMTSWEHLKDIGWHIIGPVFCMTYASLAALSRYAKSGLLNVIRADYVRTARAKGLSERVVILKHAARNGIISVITLLATTLPIVIGGSVVIESVFQIPGMGSLLLDAIFGNDFNIVIGVQMITAVLTMIGILFADILYAVVDPRISYS
ncbi:MAG: ABC transporter permease [Planctomycetota bacterium]